MTQLSLELAGYPRPIAWTLSELDRTIGDRDLRDMLLTAFESVTQYLTLVAAARYAEYFAAGERDDTVEGVLGGLRRPSFGHYVQVLHALDRFLVGKNDPLALNLSRNDPHPAATRLCEATGNAKIKNASFVALLSRVVEIRNRDKGHGFTDQQHARASKDLLQPALREFLAHLPVLLSQPLVWIERIEFLGPNQWTVTYLELMGTQRAARRPRDVESHGRLRPRFIYMWNGESAPLQLTPFFHLDENDEVVYMLAGLGADPMYQAPGVVGSRRPDPLLDQLKERAPFLLEPLANVTEARAPDAEGRYRDLLEMALADGVVTDAEAKRLAVHRRELGLSDAEAARLHESLGWSGAPTVRPEVFAVPADVGVSIAQDAPRETEPPAPLVVDAWPDAGRVLAARVREALPAALRIEPELLMLDGELDVGRGELWIQLEPSRGVSLWFPDSRRQLRDGQVHVAVGFYSQNERRDPIYRAARDRLEHQPPDLAPGWSRWSAEGKLLGSPLAFDTSRRFPIDALASDGVVEELTELLARLSDAASAALTREDEADDSAPLVTPDAPVVREVPTDFELRPLSAAERIRESLWIARILWALEWARRHDPAPKLASDLARILTDHGVRVPPTNTARAFRTPTDDPRRPGLCEEIGEQRYVITAAGRRALFELLASK